MFEYKYKSIHVQGVSIGGVETCYILPHFNIAFDVGRCPYPLIDIPKVFVTHGHLDHAAGLPYYISQRALRRLSTPDVYMPQKLYPHIKKVLNLWNKIEDFEAQANVHPLEWGDRIDIQKNYSVHVLPAYHRIPTQGYALVHQTKKLKEAYLGLPSAQIVALKKKNPMSFLKYANCLYLLFQVIPRLSLF